MYSSPLWLPTSQPRAPFLDILVLPWLLLLHQCPHGDSPGDLLTVNAHGESSLYLWSPPETPLTRTGSAASSLFSQILSDQQFINQSEVMKNNCYTTLRQGMFDKVNIQISGQKNQHLNIQCIRSSPNRREKSEFKVGFLFSSP